jgi:hypothetical protein
VFENYTASFEIDKQRIELNMWDTSGKAISWLSHSPQDSDIQSALCDICPWLGWQEDTTDSCPLTLFPTQLILALNLAIL